MERLTHDADFGFEDWEETLFFVKSDPNGAYNILDIARFQGEAEFDEILKNIALRLAAYEDTGFEPEEIGELAVKMEDARPYKVFLEDLADGQKLIEALSYIRYLAKADKDGRCVVLPCNVGDTVWRIYDDCVFPGICGKKMRCKGCEYRNLFAEEQAFCLSMLSQNGKLEHPFYTRKEAAEAALEGMKK